MISINAVSKQFSGRDDTPIVALKDVSLQVRRNRFTCLVGPSGCGKSTLLRLIGGLITPSEGRVTIDSVPVDGPRADSGIVFQAPTLLPWATVLDNVLFPSRMMNICTSASVDRARALLKLAGLSEFEGSYPRELSGGMQQRAGICRALVHDPAILLMDEPFGALDALTREEMTLELLKIWTEQPKTIVFVTHSISEAVLLADQVVVMSARPGRIAEVIDVNLPRPRNFGMESHEHFQECSQRIRNLIFGSRQHAAE